jgi:hypothetical protein
LALPVGLHEAGFFEHFEVLDDGGLGHGKRLCNLSDRQRPEGERGENRPPSGIGEGGEDKAELVGRHGLPFDYITKRFWVVRGLGLPQDLFHLAPFG